MDRKKISLDRARFLELGEGVDIEAGVAVQLYEVGLQVLLDGGLFPAHLHTGNSQDHSWPTQPPSHCTLTKLTLNA